jgi:uncharacterized protein YvpB
MQKARNEVNMKRIVAILATIVVLFGASWLLLRRESPPTPAPSGPLPDQTLLFNLTGKPQSNNLSCESRSASDLAGFWGYDVPEAKFLDSLPRADNPNRGFVGSPDAPRGSLPPIGYGVYAEPVAALLKKYGLPARAELGRGLDWLRQELAAGQPVIVWTTYDFKPQPIQSLKDSRGQQFQVVPFEHTYLAVGYSPHGIYAIDPYDGQRKFYTNAEFEAGWNQLGQMAVAVTNPKTAAVQSNTGWGVLRTCGIPLLVIGLLALAYFFWRNGGRMPTIRPQRKPGRRIPREEQMKATQVGPLERFQNVLVSALDGRLGESSESVTGYTRAHSLGLAGLVAGLLLALALGGFNPFVAVPLVAGFGVIGFVLGNLLDRRGI